MCEVWRCASDPANSCARSGGGRPQNGLLIIYPIDPVEAEVEPTDRPVISVVISFPNSDAADSRVYLINTVQQRQES